MRPGMLDNCGDSTNRLNYGMIRREACGRVRPIHVTLIFPLQLDNNRSTLRLFPARLTLCRPPSTNERSASHATIA